MSKSLGNLVPAKPGRSESVHACKQTKAVDKLKASVSEPDFSMSELEDVFKKVETATELMATNLNKLIIRETNLTHLEQKASNLNDQILSLDLASKSLAKREKSKIRPKSVVKVIAFVFPGLVAVNILIYYLFLKKEVSY